MTERNTVRAVFDHLRETLEAEIPRQLDDPHGGHYVVALLVAISSEALSRLQDQSDDTLFDENVDEPGTDDEHGVQPVRRAPARHRASLRHQVHLKPVVNHPVVEWEERTSVNVRSNPSAQKGGTS